MPSIILDPRDKLGYLTNISSLVELINSSKEWGNPANPAVSIMLVAKLLYHIECWGKAAFGTLPAMFAVAGKVSWNLTVFGLYSKHK